MDEERIKIEIVLRNECQRLGISTDGHDTAGLKTALHSKATTTNITLPLECQLDVAKSFMPMLQDGTWNNIST